MATKAQLELLIEELEAALAGAAAENEVLRARLNTGIAAFKTARGEIARLNEIIAGRRVVFVKPRTEPKPTVTRFYRNGQLWEKTRVGNVATELEIDQDVDAFYEGATEVIDEYYNN